MPASPLWNGRLVIAGRPPPGLVVGVDVGAEVGLDDGLADGLEDGVLAVDVLELGEVLAVSVDDVQATEPTIRAPTHARPLIQPLISLRKCKPCPKSAPPL